MVQQILLEVLGVGLEMHRLMQRPSLWWSTYPEQNKQNLYSTIFQMKQSGYIKEVEEKGEKRYIATLKGKAKVLRFLKRDKKWDGKWRIVVFDVPEKKRRIRNYFRARLFELGFRMLQESVWICPYNIADTVEELIELCHAKLYIHYLLVEELDNNDVLMKLFKLSGRKTQ